MFFTLIAIGFMCEGPGGKRVSRSEIDFNLGWEFSKQLDQNSQNWEKITVPHTTNIEPLIVDDQWQGISWYRKSFDWDIQEGQKILLYFEGVMQDAELWVNDEQLPQKKTPLFRHKGGYLPFSVDITNHLRNGINQLLLKVTNTDDTTIPPGKPLKDLDFNYYGGIYRDVRLIATNEVYITEPIMVGKPASGGVFVWFDKVDQVRASGKVQVHIQNDSKRSVEIQSRVSFLLGGKEITAKKSDTKQLEPGDDGVLLTGIEIESPELWNPQIPTIYDLKLDLYANGTLVDTKWEKTGIRKAELRDDGFYLNNEKLFIRGTNRHQEYPYVGYALPDNAHYRDAIKIKNAGFDMVRLSHYPQDEAFLDACDELGLIVMNAIPGWQYYEEGEFVENSYQDVRDMIRRDRNHPSVIFWETSLNESDMPEEYMVRVNQIVEEELPGVGAITAGWKDHESFDLFIPARQHNRPPDYWNQYKDGQRPVFIAEYGDWEYYAHNAGFNQTQFNDLLADHRTSRQLRKHGERRLQQQALNFQEAANSNRKGINTIGHANWVMFDYNRGYSPDLEASGISDIFRIPKFAHYFYQSQRDPREESEDMRLKLGPMVKLATYWSEDSPLEIKVYSNCEEVALYLNDELIGRQKPTSDQFSSHLPQPPFLFSLEKFVPGQLKAIGLINGQEVAMDSVHTAGIPDHISLTFDKSGIPVSSGEMDLVFVYASVLDDKNQLVSTDSSSFQFELISGNAELVGQNPINAEAGIATILLRTYDLKERVILKANATSDIQIGILEISKPKP